MRNARGLAETVEIIFQNASASPHLESYLLSTEDAFFFPSCFISFRLAFFPAFGRRSGVFLPYRFASGFSRFALSFFVISLTRLDFVYSTQTFGLE